MMPDKIQTKQQQRAVFALDEVTAICNEHAGYVPKALANLIVGIPNMILSNGIGQTLAFLLSKAKGNKDCDHYVVYNFMKKWLQKDMSTVFPIQKNDLDFLKTFMSLSESDYLKAQHECLNLLEWFKRYARAFAEKEKEKSE
jgi:CRISPR-associated protein Cmr5